MKYVHMGMRELLGKRACCGMIHRVMDDIMHVGRFHMMEWYVGRSCLGCIWSRSCHGMRRRAISIKDRRLGQRHHPCGF